MLSCNPSHASCRGALQGAALSELQAFFPALARSNAPQAQPEVLLAALLEEGQGHAGTSKQAQHSVAQCVAVLCTSSDGRLQGTVQQLLGMLQGKDTGKGCDGVMRYGQPHYMSDSLCLPPPPMHLRTL